MKLLITTDCFLPRWDGIARFLSELIPQLKKQFEITVVAPDFEGITQKKEDIRIVQLPLGKIRFADIRFAKSAKKKIKELVKEADVVFNQTIGPIGISAIRSAEKSG